MKAGLVCYRRESINDRLETAFSSTSSEDVVVDHRPLKFFEISFRGERHAGGVSCSLDEALDLEVMKIFQLEVFAKKL